jgi:DMSO/TMAO reductase YedYZ molybdopterin-dependent catalytic subunit
VSYAALGRVRDDGGVTIGPRGRLALAGAVTGISGIAVSAALTNLLNARITPIEGVAEVVIAKTPGPVAESLIHVVGRNDKPLLVGGVTVAIVALSAVAGVLTVRSRVAANLLLVAMGAVALLAEMSRPGFAPASLLPLVAGLVTWLLVLSFLTDAVLGRAPRPSRAGSDQYDVPETAPPDGSGPSRRSFLIKTGVVAALALVVGVGGEALGKGRRAVENSRRLLHLPVTRGVVPQGADVGVAGLTPWRVSNTNFYRIDTALVIPEVAPSSWSLRIHGMVDKEIRLTFDDLLKRKLTEAWVTICCVSNPVGGPLIGNAWWSGVRIAPLLAEAGVHPDADAVLQTSKDGWTCGTPVSALTDGRNAMLAVAMNGQPLPIEHGYPVRMIVPGLYGFVSACKWLVDIEVTQYSRFTAYWTERGWSPQAPIKTESRIQAPRDGGTVPGGTVRVGGQAWAQHTGIAKVEYRLDGNAWAQAELGRVPGNDTWVQWAGTIPNVASGSHTLAVRATDKSGYTQTPVRAGVVPNGATGWDTISFTAS